MRFFDLSATVLTAAALFHGATATPQDSYASTTAATEVVTITRTVSRVVQTEWATRSTASITPSFPPTTRVAPTGSLPPPAYKPGNGTSILPTGAVPSVTSTPHPYAGAAGRLSIEALGVAALAGIVGFMAL